MNILDDDPMERRKSSHKDDYSNGALMNAAIKLKSVFQFLEHPDNYIKTPDQLIKLLS